MAVVSALGVACGDGGEDEEHSHGDDLATATIEAKSGNTTLAGTARVTGMPGALSVTVTVTGAPPGEHGVHIHETGDCTEPEAMSAGGHWNPTMHMHGAPGPMTHLGELGNMTVAADGTGMVSVMNPLWEAGTGTPMDVVGKALVVHAMPDDFMTQPSGNSGARIGCGVFMAHEH
jgi:Cu-Zn family superoxide dismutase